MGTLQKWHWQVRAEFSSLLGLCIGLRSTNAIAQLEMIPDLDNFAQLKL
jgi:hypothetical protein